MSSCSTGKPSSESKSTARWAEEYSSNRATVFHAALTGFTVSLPYIMATSFRLVFRPAFSR
jgi:hypothetical protein